MSIDFLIELYKDLPKMGAGSPETIRNVVSMLELPTNPTILDVGCGTGMTSIELAKISRGKVVALDLIQDYLDVLRERAEKQGVSDRIQIVQKDMRSMDFEKDSFDVIWSENSVFLVGFEKALRDWRRFLKKQGYLVISVLAKLKDDPPIDAKDYWEYTYPAMRTHNEIEDIIRAQRYKLIGSLKIPDADYWDTCYTPLEKKIEVIREKYASDKQSMEWLDLNQMEIDIFRKYGSEYYGCLFYVMQNV